MIIKIYQINSERDKDRLKFESLQNTKKLQGNVQINAEIYDKVFEGDVDCNNLEDVFRQFNTEGHPLHRGHSLSVSDIIEVCGDVPNTSEFSDKSQHQNNPSVENGTYFCDSIGFSKVDFDTAQAHFPDNLMRVVYVEPNKTPYVTDIENSLEGEQKAVFGMIELIYNDDGTILVGNEEAKLIGMEGNRKIFDGSCIIAGPFFVVGDDGENFCSLTDEQVEKYMQKFAEPEEISQEETQSDMGFEFYC